MNIDKNKAELKKKLLIIGGGYAGFWSALSAVRQSREIKKETDLEVILINTDNYFTMRPRLYEVSLDGLRIKLDEYLKPLGIKQIIGKAEVIEPELNQVLISTAQGTRTLNYDYLILAAGSSLKALNLPGIENTFNIDTFDNAQTLEDHIIKLAKRDFAHEGDDTFIIAGAGLTGLEAVTNIEEKAKKMETLFSKHKTNFKVILVERDKQIGTFYAPEARQYLIDTIASKNIDVRTNTLLTAIEPSFVILNNDLKVPSSTVIWTVGLIASPLTKFFNGERDVLSRLPVNGFLKLDGYPNVIIAGDVANVKVDEDRSAVMSCQFSQFQGRWAGHNAVNDIFGQPLKEYIQNGYTTCVDLGTDHAMITYNWERMLHKTGNEAKVVKNWICTELIYPSADPEEALIESYPQIPKF